MKIKQFILLSGITIFTISCNKTPEFTPTCDGSTPTYDADISLILQQNCNQCHGSGSSNGDYSSYSGLSNVISNGDFEKEVLTNQSMPQNSSLSEAQLNTIKCWIENGYPEN